MSHFDMEIQRLPLQKILQVKFILPIFDQELAENYSSFRIRDRRET